MAGSSAAEAANGNKEALPDYVHGWRKTFGAMMDKAAQKRQVLETGWNKKNLEGLVRRCWITCEEYYREP
jgi:hypothetical protein